MKRVALSVGEPAGIGPDITIQLAQQEWPCQIVAVANQSMLQQRAEQLGLPLECLPFDSAVRESARPGQLFVLDQALAEAVEPGQLNVANAAYVVAAIKRCAQLCMDGDADALVTAPVHKGVICDSGVTFSGHTEYLAELAAVDRVVMMLANSDLRVALVTTHMRLRDVVAAITPDRLRETISIIHKALPKFGFKNPKIVVCGLNPHAGEGGHLGDEEIHIIAPVIEAMKKEGLDLHGPVSADTAFMPANTSQYDVILAMYHDQGLAPIKTIGFKKTVNVTLGLPFVRTSVDHGTALDLAGSGRANAGSLKAALEMAIR